MSEDNKKLLYNFVPIATLSFEKDFSFETPNSGNSLLLNIYAFIPVPSDPMGCGQDGGMDGGPPYC